MRFIMSNAVDFFKEKILGFINVDREKFVEMYEHFIHKDLSWFLTNRVPNKTIDDVYRGFHAPEGIFDATNYKQSLDSLGWRGNCQVTNRPNFEVDFIPDHKVVIRKLAETKFDKMVQVFLEKNISKLGPIIERRTLKEISMTGKFVSSTWIGYIKLVFEGGLEFKSEFKIIHNISKYKLMFVQYHMILKEVKLEGTNNYVPISSIENVWKSVGYCPELPNVKPNWKTLVIGSVLWDSNKHVVIKTLPDLKSYLDDPSVTQVARLKVLNLSCIMEDSQGNVRRYSYTSNDKCLWVNEPYHKHKSIRLAIAFEHFYGKG